MISLPLLVTFKFSFPLNLAFLRAQHFVFDYTVQQICEFYVFI